MPGQVIGLDASAEVVAQAQAHATGAEATNVRFEVGDLFALRYEDATFDVVHAHQVLQHLVDPVAALVELRRVLRPGGVLAARDSDYGAFVWAPADPALDRWIEIYLAVTARNGHNARIGPALLGLAHAAGFSTRSRCPARPGPSPNPSRAGGGAACGPIGSSTPVSPSRPSPTD